MVAISSRRAFICIVWLLVLRQVSNTITLPHPQARRHAAGKAWAQCVPLSPDLPSMSSDTPTDTPAQARAPALPPTLGPEACAALLKQHFAALFGGAPKPLKLRIQADIQARAPGIFSKSALSGFLRQHTSRHAYLLALTRADQRFDLDGQPAGELSAEHRQAALDELARRRGLREAREAEMLEQRRNRAALLRAFDGSTLTVANFCALKGIAEDELEGLLDRARAEAREQAQTPAPALRARNPPRQRR
jgi:hypothetical protein